MIFDVLLGAIFIDATLRVLDLQSKFLGAIQTTRSLRFSVEVGLFALTADPVASLARMVFSGTTASVLPLKAVITAIR